MLQSRKKICNWNSNKDKFLQFNHLNQRRKKKNFLQKMLNKKFYKPNQNHMNSFWKMSHWWMLNKKCLKFLQSKVAYQWPTVYLVRLKNKRKINGIFKRFNAMFKRSNVMFKRFNAMQKRVSRTCMTLCQLRPNKLWNQKVIRQIIFWRRYLRKQYKNKKMKL